MGNTKFISSTNNRRLDAEVDDYYATPPEAVKLLLEKEKFYPYIWECACCNTHHDRDVNAAINILNEGLRILEVA